MPFPITGAIAFTADATVIRPVRRTVKGSPHTSPRGAPTSPCDHPDASASALAESARDSFRRALSPFTRLFIPST
ncbi:hypothetical protein AB0M95_40255, partial [Sphaerisporangium sp. NPDC051017]|uniref:hypothetical protein n=1 Tax=Sphaerisporangium sp. NPDC051017 TaxID=3154636 RepID=UPI00341793F3